MFSFTSFAPCWPKTLDGTLAKVAALGIKRVEFAGFYGRTAKEVRASLSNAGLVASGAHCLLATMSDDEVRGMTVSVSARR